MVPARAEVQNRTRPSQLSNMTRIRQARPFLTLLCAVVVLSYFGQQFFTDNLVVEYGISICALLAVGYIYKRRARNQP
jgi:hypothetical protein